MYVSRIISSTDKPAGENPVNVLKWTGKWREFSPYYMKTDEETRGARAGILFENYYQGLKVYPRLYAHEVYPSRFQRNRPPRWAWKEDVEIIRNGVLWVEKYNEWRESVWACDYPLRYPNTIHRRSECVYSLVDGVQYNYAEARRLYRDEYCRLARKSPKYSLLLNMHPLTLAEIDVPAAGKAGLHGECAGPDNITPLTLELLERLFADLSAPFGHGLCLAYALLSDRG